MPRSPARNLVAFQTHGCLCSWQALQNGFPIKNSFSPGGSIDLIFFALRSSRAVGRPCFPVETVLKWVTLEPCFVFQVTDRSANAPPFVPPPGPLKCVS